MKTRGSSEECGDYKLQVLQGGQTTGVQEKCNPGSEKSEISLGPKS